MVSVAQYCTRLPGFRVVASDTAYHMPSRKPKLISIDLTVPESDKEYMSLQWEYRILEFDLDKPRAPQALNNAGRDGWEAIAGSLRAAGDADTKRPDRLIVLLKRLRIRA